MQVAWNRPNRTLPSGWLVASPNPQLSKVRFRKNADFAVETGAAERHCSQEHDGFPAAVGAAAVAEGGGPFAGYYDTTGQ